MSLAFVTVILAGIAVVGRAACGRHREARAPTPLRPLRLAVSPIPDLAVAARVGIEAPGATSVVIRYGRNRAYDQETPRIPMPAGGTLSTTLLGLDAGASSQVVVTATYSNGSIRSSEDVTVVTPPRNPLAPERLEVTVAGQAMSDVLMLSLNGEKSGGVAVIADRKGRVVWYRSTGSGGPSAFDKLPNGRLIVHHSDEHSFDEIELDGRVVRRWKDEKSISGSDGHDVRPLSNGNVLLFGAETHVVDSQAVLPGGVARALRWDDTVSELTPEGNVVWKWSSWAHFSEKEIILDAADPDGFDPKDYEVVHTNSIEPTPDGDIVLCFRNVGAVAKIHRATGDVLWRLGGRRSDFRFVGDSLGGFNRQHDARLVGENRVLLFDNGNFHAPPESRAAEYALDTNSKTATLVWQYRRSPHLFARVSGSVQRLPNGDTLISWGPRGIVTQVDRAGKIVWEARAGGFGAYRARAVPPLYP
jgi:hypothetical protein